MLLSGFVLHVWVCLIVGFSYADILTVLSKSDTPSWCLPFYVVWAFKFLITIAISLSSEDLWFYWVSKVWQDESFCSFYTLHHTQYGIFKGVISYFGTYFMLFNSECLLFFFFPLLFSRFSRLCNFFCFYGWFWWKAEDWARYLFFFFPAYSCLFVCSIAFCFCYMLCLLKLFVTPIFVCFLNFQYATSSGSLQRIKH